MYPPSSWSMNKLSKKPEHGTINGISYSDCWQSSIFFLNGSTALVGPRLFFSFYSIHNRQGSLNEWSAHRKASTETLDGKWRIILLIGPLGASGSLTCSKFTTRVKQFKVPPGGLVPSLKIRRPPPGLNPRRSSHEVGTLPLDYEGRWQNNIGTLILRGLRFTNVKAPTYQSS
jgi:hypothetical protein